MKTFLEYVAQDIIRKYGNNLHANEPENQTAKGIDLSQVTVVFPNKRASLFLNEYLIKTTNRPIWSPTYTTIRDLFTSQSQRIIADEMRLVCLLYRCFNHCTQGNESLDHFYSWGQLLLSDFDDIDKKLADPAKVFTNLKDLHEMDDVSYLSNEQIEIIKTFFSNFKENYNSELKKRFLSLWSHFYDIYTLFNATLKEQNIAYEGALYREVVEKDALNFNKKVYLFVGFNALQNVEKRLFIHLKEQGKARFYWDFDKYYIGEKSPVTEAGRSIRANMDIFCNELDNTNKEIFDSFSRPKSISFVSANTENAQARYVKQWLKEGKRIDDGKKTAIVLCNENLLTSVIHCIPEKATKVNITTGWPLIQSPAASLVQSLIVLQQRGWEAKSATYRLRYVNNILKHSYIKYISNTYKQLYASLNENTKVYHPTKKQLSTDSGLALIFNTIDAFDGATKTIKMMEWLTNVVGRVAKNAIESYDSFTNEALFKTYTLLNRVKILMQEGLLDIDIPTLQRLIVQLIRSNSIPFLGEPIQGIQVMGVLETRNLDFDHLLLLSVNEGNMPKGTTDTSFIPYTLRKAYGLTTTENKCEIYAYHFYRLLQRASDITITYNNSTEGNSGGQMSRFLLQLLVESNIHIDRYSLQSNTTASMNLPLPIIRTSDMQEALIKRFDKFKQCTTSPKTHLGKDRNEVCPLLTPTAINLWMKCNKMFYYRYVLGLREQDDVDDDNIDSKMFGDLFHNTAFLIYERLTKKSKEITKESLESLLSNKSEIENTVDEAFFALTNNEKGGLLSPENHNKLPMKDKINYNGLQLINRHVIVDFMRYLIEFDKKQAPFDILYLEEDVMEEYEIQTPTFSFTTVIGGRVDRIDCVRDAKTGKKRLRVIDYKTGSNKATKPKTTSEIFDLNNKKDGSSYYLQTFLYSMLVRRSERFNPDGLDTSPTLLYVKDANKENFNPTLKLDTNEVEDIQAESESFSSLLREIINEIFDPNKDFIPTTDRKNCDYCPYKTLCLSIQNKNSFECF